MKTLTKLWDKARAKNRDVLRLRRVNNSAATSLRRSATAPSKVRELIDFKTHTQKESHTEPKHVSASEASEASQLIDFKTHTQTLHMCQQLIDFKTRRVAAFRKNLVELAELELKHAKGNLQLLQSCLGVLKGNT
ncbi:hypothetical protein WMY93_032725 [Mugilogobius chulae]|uniref:Uncharacterized protein n=1 Tax=Mugilogobius chulae TaxID=88201 RepID=A0AAW0MIV7_9GOBI